MEEKKSVDSNENNEEKNLTKDTLFTILDNERVSLSIEEIFKRIELYYNVQIVCHSAQLLNTHYTGKFRVRDGIDHIMQVIQMDNGFNYTMNDDRSKIIIN